VARFTQILLFISYAIVGLAVVVIPPKVFGLDQTVFGFIGMFVFFGAWELQNWLIASRTEINSQTRLDQLEDVVHIMRKDIARTRREVESRGREGEAKSDTLVSELKMLQTLLTQVTRKEAELSKGSTGGRDVAVATEEEALELSIDHSATTESKEDLQTEAKTGNQDEGSDPSDGDEITESDIEDLHLTPEEAALVVMDDGEHLATAGDDGADSSALKSSAKRATPRAGARRKAPIRLIKREDQLLKVVRSSLSENRVDLYLQPIVTLPSRRTMHYECFSRVRDEEGRIILPRQYMKVAENKGLIGTIDNLLLFRLIQLVRRLGKRQPDLRFFCNMSRYSMTDNEFFPQFIDFMMANEEFSNRLIFEISQDDYNALDDEVIERLMTLGRKGFGFSMDMVKDFNQNFAELEKHYFKFIKGDLPDLMNSHPEPGDVEDFKKSLRRKGMQLIATRIEEEDKILQALEAHVEFAQGYLFGEPTSANDMNNEL